MAHGSIALVQYLVPRYVCVYVAGCIRSTYANEHRLCFVSLKKHAKRICPLRKHLEPGLLDYWSLGSGPICTPRAAHSVAQADCGVHTNVSGVSDREAVSAVPTAIHLTSCDSPCHLHGCRDSRPLTSFKPTGFDNMYVLRIKGWKVQVVVTCEHVRAIQAVFPRFFPAGRYLFAVPLRPFSYLIHQMVGAHKDSQRRFIRVASTPLRNRSPA